MQEFPLKIKFYAPLDKIFDPVRELDVAVPVSVGETLRILGDETPGFTPFSGFGPDDTHPHGLLVWRKGELLTLKDLIGPGDEVEMIVMVAGG
jgi:hypothetical protein